VVSRQFVRPAGPMQHTSALAAVVPMTGIELGVT
jgi:hypothetical protein